MLMHVRFLLLLLPLGEFSPAAVLMKCEEEEENDKALVGGFPLLPPKPAAAAASEATIRKIMYAAANRHDNRHSDGSV